MARHPPLNAINLRIVCLKYGSFTVIPAHQGMTVQLPLFYFDITKKLILLFSN